MLADLPLDLQCSSREGALMVLGQHSADAGVEPRDLLRTLERGIQTLQLRFVQQARLYLRVSGESRPYAQRFFLIQPPPPPLRMEAPSEVESPAVPKLAATVNAVSPVVSSQTEPEEAPWVVSDDELDSLLHELVGETSLDAFLPAFEMGDRSSIPADPAAMPVSPLEPVDDLVHAFVQTPIAPIAPPLAEAMPASLTATVPGLLPEPWSTEPEPAPKLGTDWPGVPPSLSLIPYPGPTSELTEVPPDLGDAWVEGPAPSPTPLPATVIPDRRRWVAGGAIALGVAGGLYGLSRPCVVTSQCAPIDSAEALQAQSVDEAEAASEVADLQNARRPLQDAIAQLETIPVWSGHSRQARQLERTYSAQADTLERVMAIAELGTTAQQKREAAPLSVESWQEVVGLWETAINRLDAIQPTSPYYRAAQQLRQQYRVYRTTDLRQLEAEQDAQAILNMARQGIEMATAREQIAATADQWQLVRITWQVVVNRLNQVPPNSYAGIEAKRLLLGYEPRLAAAIAQQTQESEAVALLNQARTLAAEAQESAQQANWEGAIAAWSDALRHTEQIPANSAQAPQATELSRAYTAAINQAQAKLQQHNAIALEIDRVCNQEFRKCRLASIGQTVRVDLSPAYVGAIAQARDSGNRDLQAIVAEHQLNLRKSLEELAARFRLPIEVYDDDNTLLDRHNPPGNTPQ